MKRVVCVILCTFSLMLLQCTMAMDAGNASETDHPIPTTPGIIPLQEGNRWIFRYTMFDSIGLQESFPDRDLKLEITGIYFLDSVRGLVRISRLNWRDSAERYYYRYEWESLDSGYIVYHQGTGPVNERGLYIAGTFVDSHAVLFDTARLWYAYPAGDAVVWKIDLPGGDTAFSTVECVSKTTAAWMYRQHADDFSPLLFLDSCYLYRQTVGDDAYYHCFHPLHGRVSMRHYHRGVLRESYLLIAEVVYP